MNSINNLGNNIEGTTPGFINEGSQDYRLLQESECINRGIQVPVGHPVSFEYVKHQQKEIRNISEIIDMGAYEYYKSSYINTLGQDGIYIFPNPVHDKVIIRYPKIIFKISIVNISGQEFSLKFSPGYEINVDLNNFEKGIYILKIFTESGIIIKKISLN